MDFTSAQYVEHVAESVKIYLDKRRQGQMAYHKMFYLEING